MSEPAEKQMSLSTASDAKLAISEPTTAQLMQAAIEKLSTPGAEQAVAALEKLVALKERMDDRQAERDYAVALAAFQAGCPPIPKSKRVDVMTKSGMKYGYGYAPLEEIMKLIRPVAEKHGFAITWDSEVNEGMVKAECKIMHQNGHYATATFTAPIDDRAAMNKTQQHAAALTYAQRYSLLQVLGVVTGDIDTDAVSVEKISENQVVDLEALIEETETNKDKVLAYAKAEKLSEIRATDYPGIIAHLETKRRRG